MEISERLQKIADAVTAKTVADIGTDHAYIPIYLCKNKGINKAIASDVNKQPLEKAERNITRYRLSDRIETRLGNGLEQIEPAEVEAVTIAGMGGMLMVDILNQDKAKTRSFRQLILQPQLDVLKVRQCLHEIGFKIVNEEMLVEDSIFYTVITAEQGQDCLYNDLDYAFGKILIERKDSVLKAFLQSEIQKQTKIQMTLEGLDSDASRERRREILAINQIYEELYQCL